MNSAQAALAQERADTAQAARTRGGMQADAREGKANAATARAQERADTAQANLFAARRSRVKDCDRYLRGFIEPTAHNAAGSTGQRPRLRRRKQKATGGNNDARV